MNRRIKLATILKHWQNFLPVPSIFKLGPSNSLSEKKTKRSIRSDKCLGTKTELSDQALINETRQTLTQENCKGLEWSQTRCIVPDSAKGMSSFLRRFSQQSMPLPCLYLTSSSVHSVGFCNGPSFHSSTQNFRVVGTNDIVVLLSFPVAEMTMEMRFHWNPVLCGIEIIFWHMPFKIRTRKSQNIAGGKRLFWTLSVFISFVIPRIILIRSIKFIACECRLFKNRHF